MKRLLTGFGISVVAAAALFVPATHLVSLPYVAPPEEPVRVVFVGDIMLDRNVARTIAAEGPDVLFTEVHALLADADLRVGNLEGTITHTRSIAQQDNSILRFTFDPSQAKAVLAPLHFDAFSLANNHALDFGKLGYDETREQVTDALGAEPFGQPFNNSGELSALLETRGKTVCLVGYHALYNGATTTAANEIVRLRPDCWRVVVFAHWGEEYQAHSGATQQAAARAFIDAGADLVIGAHPHVVQEVEVYRDKAIFYSLGNFMFDQNFSWATTHGLAVRVDFYEAQTRFFLTPTTVRGQKAGIAQGVDRQKVLDIATVADFTLP